MLQNIHRGTLSLADVLEEWVKEADRLPSLERDLAQLLELTLNGPDGLAAITVSIPGKAAPDILTVMVPVEKLVEAKRAEIGELMDRLGNCCKAMDEACTRLMTFDPRPVEKASEEVLVATPMVGVARY
jgi:hypothetical protein